MKITTGRLKEIIKEELMREMGDVVHLFPYKVMTTASGAPAQFKDLDAAVTTAVTWDAAGILLDDGTSDEVLEGVYAHRRYEDEERAIKRGGPSPQMTPEEHEEYMALYDEEDIEPLAEGDDPCWEGYEMIGMKKKGGKEVPNCVPVKSESIDESYYAMLSEGEVIEEAEYQGRKVTLNKPMQGDVKKSKVYVKNDKGNVVKVNFGDPDMTIKKHDPARRKSFRARHNCDNPGPKWKARYWSCKAW